MVFYVDRTCFYQIYALMLCVLCSLAQLGCVKVILEERKQRWWCGALLELFNKPQGQAHVLRRSTWVFCKLLKVSE